MIMNMSKAVMSKAVTGFLLLLPLLRNRLFETTYNHFRSFLWAVLSYGGGPIPNHVAIIMDGNRRYARNRKLEIMAGHEYGAEALMSTLRYCCEMGVSYVTVYAFSIDNFNRNPAEVRALMDLMVRKIDELIKEESLVNRFGVGVRFLGDLSLLPENLRVSAEKAMAATAGNSKRVVSVCVAYTSYDEIVNAVDRTWREEKGEIGVDELERNLYTAGLPEPDILIRTSGETRLSNFLLWQTGSCYLHISDVLWPEFSLLHLVWAVLEYQRLWPYLPKQKGKGVGKRG